MLQVFRFSGICIPYPAFNDVRIQRQVTQFGEDFWVGVCNLLRSLLDHRFCFAPKLRFHLLKLAFFRELGRMVSRQWTDALIEAVRSKYDVEDEAEAFDEFEDPDGDCADEDEDFEEVS